jgi:CubicO group peptidase (beta-lactamase class C family)
MRPCEDGEPRTPGHPHRPGAKSIGPAAPSLDSRGMGGLDGSVDRIAEETAFSGVVRVDGGDDVRLLKAYGLAHRGLGVANEIDTQFGIASGTKGLTALTVVSLFEQGPLKPTTTARSVLGEDLPLIDDEVTVEDLLAHRSGIGDYFDEETDHPITDYVLPIPVHELATTEAYLRVLDGYPTKFPPGKRFSYCNGGYVILALIAERSTGTPFHELVVRRVCDPAGMSDTGFFRSDKLPGRAATGYLGEGLRTNVFHLPVRGSGDGGIYSTAADISSMWQAMFTGRIVAMDRVAEVVRPHSDVPSKSARYGLGFWLHESRPVIELHGYDAGASFRSVHDPVEGLTYTVLSNTTEGAWPLTELLDELLMQ